MSSNYCQRCGTAVSQDGRFCANCGAAIPAEDASQPPPPTVSPEYPVVMQPAARRTAKRFPVFGWLALGVAVVALAGGVGWYLWSGRDTRVDSIAEFRRAMEKHGWDSLEEDPGSFVAKSEYDLEDYGFAQLIEYLDEDVAAQAQRDRRDLLSSTPGFEVSSDGSVYSTLLPAGNEFGQQPGMGSLEVLFGKYRFESYGDRSKLDALVNDLGYMDAERERSDPFEEFRTAMDESGLATSSDQGYTERSPFEDADLSAECKVFHTAEDAQADFDTTVEQLAETDREFEKSTDGDVQSIWFITEWPNDEGEQIMQYASRVYVGKMIIAISGPVESRSEIDALMEDMGY